MIPNLENGLKAGRKPSANSPQTGREPTAYLLRTGREPKEKPPGRDRGGFFLLSVEFSDSTEVPKDRSPSSGRSAYGAPGNPNAVPGGGAAPSFLTTPRYYGNGNPRQIFFTFRTFRVISARTSNPPPMSESPWPETFRKTIEEKRKKFSELRPPNCAPNEIPKPEWYGKRKTPRT